MKENNPQKEETWLERMGDCYGDTDLQLRIIMPRKVGRGICDYCPYYRYNKSHPRINYCSATQDWFGPIDNTVPCLNEYSQRKEIRNDKRRLRQVKRHS